MSQNSWFEHFKEQLQGLTEAHAAAGSSLSLLGYALKEKRLSSEEYFNWAVTHHKLPKLQSRFFTETPLSQEMFAKWATHYRWSVECLPVAEWDGSLIVVCLQPPQDFPSFPTSVLVLTELENIENAWHQFHAAPAPVVTPEDLSDKTVVAKSSDSFSFEDLGVAGSSDAAESTNSGVEVVQESAPSEDSNGDEPLAGIFDGPTVVKLQAVGDSPLKTPPPKTEAPREEASITVALPETTTRIATSTPLSPPPLPKSETGDSLEDSFSNRPIPAPAITPRPVGGVAKPMVNPVPNGNFALEKIKKKNSSVVNERIKEVLSEMKIYFDKSMILTVDEQETQLVAFAWDESFKDIKDTNMRFPLKTPSIFNIVVSTQKPYHGYVSLNDINERFFDDWNHGKVPDHVTITPLIVQEKIVGLLIGFADKTAYNKIALTLAEKLSSDFVKDLQAA